MPLSRFTLTTYPAVRLSCFTLTLLCLYFLRTYPAVPYFTVYGVLRTYPK